MEHLELIASLQELEQHVHTFIGSRSAEGEEDLFNILHPWLFATTLYPANMQGLQRVAVCQALAQDRAYFRLGKAVVQLWQARHNLEADGVRGAMVALGALQVALQPLMRGQTTPARVMQPLEPSTSAAMSQLAECGLRALLPEMLNEMAEQIEEAPAIDPVWLLILQPWDPDRGAMQHLAGTASLMVQHVVTCLCARVWASADTTDLCIAGARLVIAGTQWCSQQLHDGERPSCYSAVADVALRMFAEVVRARHIGEQVDSTTPWGSPSEQGPV